MKNLPEYLQPPIEPFFNTGIDPDKAIKTSDIAPNAPTKVQEKLHNEVAEKISKTMGYGRQDVQEALEAEEPSAIKDAYMIVRENKLMQVNPLLGENNPYFPSSPPSVDEATSGMEALKTGPPPTEPDSGSSPLASSARSITSTSTAASPRPYVSKVGVMPSSLPAYHKDFMERERTGVDEPLGLPVAPEPSSQPRSEDERQESLRRLKPHTRNSIKLDESSKRPQGLTPVNPPKKPKATRWQFGIRSRNAPWEALGVIYRSLSKLGCSWVPDEDYDKEHREDEQTGHRRAASSRANDPTKIYKLPADPWHIQVRWETEKLRKGAHLPEDHPSTTVKSGDDEYQVVAMRMDIQIYEMAEAGSYLVDFKCDGYETPDGKIMEEKQVTSPFPFLDLAARLIMQLADAE